MKISHRAQLVLEKLNIAGFEAYVVGGCVRDLVMGKSPSDWDITTNARPEQVLEIFSDFFTIPTGLKHGTVTVMLENEPFEVTTFRVDGEYCDHRRPKDVRFVSSLNDDLARRDFTVNAMAYNPKIGICDPFSGLEDIKRKTIRAVGEPEVRFSEDALRILRALRFSSTLGFEIEEKTMYAAQRCAPTLHEIARERITVEFEKMILGADALRVIEEGEQILRFVFERPLDTRGLATAPLDLVTRLAIVFKESPENLSSLCLSRDMKTRLSRLISYNGNQPRMIVRDLGDDAERYAQLLSAKGEDVSTLLSQLADIREKQLCCTQAQLAISGRDLIDAGMKPGRSLGYVLNRVLDAVISDEVQNEREKLIKYAFDIAGDL